ncbi:LysE family translocator [Saccharomonospora halophila]|uniref:LysE family translocator n=1 Tax=Saccharomonospora halophila TaxID=129922 RepID=UPI00037DF6FC|nr:LysE family translocator [Saccharomonospora halophila]
MVKLAGGAYLIVLGVRALLQARHDVSEATTSTVASPPGSPWRIGLVSNLLNPKIAVFYTGLLPTLAPSGLPPQLGMALLVLAHAALTLGWLGGYVLVLARSRAFFDRPAVRRAMNRIAGVVPIGFGLRVATSQP